MKAVLHILIIMGLVITGPMTAFAEGDEVTQDDIANRPTVVQVPVVLAPMADEAGELLYYVYLLIEIEIVKSTDRWSVEEKIPYIKDAFVRELHAKRNDLPEKPGEVDLESIRERLRKHAVSIVPDASIGKLFFRDVAVPTH